MSQIAAQSAAVSAASPQPAIVDIHQAANIASQDVGTPVSVSELAHTLGQINRQWMITCRKARRGHRGKPLTPAERGA